MLRNGHITLLGAAFAMLLSGCWGQISRKPPIHPNKNMDHQKRVEDQEPSEFFADGRGNRAYVEGTVRTADMQGTQPPCYLPESNTELCQGKDAAGEYIKGLPAEIELNADLLDRGQERYDVFCAPCHDTAGYGNGTVAKRGLVPVSLHQEYQRTKGLGEIYKTIYEGGAIMPSYATQIPVEDRWAIAAWVRTLQASQFADASTVPADRQGGEGK